MAKVVIRLRDAEPGALREAIQQKHRLLKTNAVLSARRELQRRGIIPAEAAAADVSLPRPYKTSRTIAVRSRRPNVQTIQSDHGRRGPTC